jgi:hypothetical protein
MKHPKHGVNTIKVTPKANKFYFIHMNSNVVGTTPKHPRTINGNVKNLSKRRIKENNFYFENLILPETLPKLLANYSLTNTHHIQMHLKV